MKNLLEQLQEERNGMKFIKSYPILNKSTSTTAKQNQFIELVLSYQHNDQEFYMKYEDIADLLSIEYQSVKDMVRKLKKLGIFITTNRKNYNGQDGGSKTSIKVDEDKLINLIKEPTSIESNPIEPTITKANPIEPTITKANPIEPTITKANPIKPDEDEKTFGGNFSVKNEKPKEFYYELYNKKIDLINYCNKPLTLEVLMKTTYDPIEQQQLKEIYLELNPT